MKLFYAFALTTLFCFDLRAFENPGGMWTPMRIAEHAQTLSELGVEHPETMSDTLNGPLSSLVSLDGCSASFVSSDGLIITNHHCVISILQFNSTPDSNLVENGYAAKTREQELKAPPSNRVFVNFEFNDVTGTMRAGLEKIGDPLKRQKEIEKRATALTKAAEAERKDLKCEVKSYYDGQRYYLIKRREIKDVRLVLAPPMSVGSFGGDIDNWHWPRHAGDFAFLRAYVDRDGNSAPYSPDNVPYRPKNYFRVSTEPLKPNDFVMVAGFPGRTERLKTSFEYRFLIDVANPFRIETTKDLIGVYKNLGDSDAGLKVKLGGPIFYRMNSLLFLEALQKQVKGACFVSTVEGNEKGLDDWIHADSARAKKWGNALATVKGEADKYARKVKDYMILDVVLGTATMVSSAYAIIRMAEERPKRDEDREPGYQEKDWERLIASQATAQKNYDRRIDIAALEYLVDRIGQSPCSIPKSKILHALLGTRTADKGAIANILNDLYAGSELESVEVRQRLLKEGNLHDLKQSKDRLIRLALRLRPVMKKMEDIRKTYAANLSIIKPNYMDALLQYKGGMVAPDANSSLRITYGVVRGYKPQENAPEYHPFSSLSELLKKDTGEDPFNSPATLLTAAKLGDFGTYKDSALNDLPVDFLSDLDITGGNSGSPVLNRRFEIVGAAFDGNYEGISSNYLFDKEVSRTIAVDIRYVLWYLDAVCKAHNVLSELGITPQFN
jgi:hypothetical protein